MIFYNKKISIEDNMNLNPQVYKYDAALSFAGEDRNYVKKVAEYLRDKGMNVFYDEFEEADLLGKDLAEHLYAVYTEQSRFSVVFASNSYARKNWTIYERRNFLARSIEKPERELFWKHTAL